MKHSPIAIYNEAAVVAKIIAKYTGQQINSETNNSESFATTAVGSATSAKVTDRKDLTQVCVGIDGSAILLLMAAALSAMVAGWMGTIRNMNGSRIAFAASLALQAIGMAGAIEATVVINSMIGR